MHSRTLRRHGGCRYRYTTLLGVLCIDRLVSHALYAPPLGVLQKFQDRKHDVIDVTEATCFEFLCMMQPSCPIDRNVCLSTRELPSCGNGSSSILAEIVVHSVKDRTVVSYIELGQYVCELGYVLRCDSAESGSYSTFKRWSTDMTAHLDKKSM